MISKPFVILALSSALLFACKPTPRTAVDAAHKPATSQQETPADLPPAEEAQPQAAPAIGLLEIDVTRQDYNRLRPWEKQNMVNGSFMGVYLGNGRVLAPGLAARATTYAELCLPDGSRRAPARVVKFDNELNLALFTVERAEDASIFEGMPELSIGEPLALNDHAEVCALLREQEQVRIEVEAESADDEKNLPRLELRAAKPLPNGNAVGLPILREGKLVALTEQYKAGALSLTCLNAEFITRFLNESSGAGESVPVLGLVFSELDDPVFSKYLKIDPQQGGVYVSKVQPGSASETAGVQEGDVLTAIDGLPLDKLGRAQHPLYGLLGAPHMIRSLKPVGQELTLSLSRKGEPLQLAIPLNRDAVENSLLRQEKPGLPPRYIMWGGLVFQPLSETYLQALEGSAGNLPLPFLHVKDKLNELRKEGLQEIVALTLVVPTAATLGYDSLGFCIVEQVNGVRVISFDQFAELLDAPTEDGVVDLTINRSPYHLYLDRRTAESANDTIRRRAIPRLRQMGPQTTPEP